MIKKILITSILASSFLSGSTYIQPKPFTVTGQAKQTISDYNMPIITWADALLAVDNQNLFPKGIHLQDNLQTQINDVVSGKTPFIRQTLGSAIFAVDALKKAGVEMEVFHSVSDSLGGDVIVANKRIKNLNDLKKKKGKPVIAIQWGGPHMGWLIQVLDSIGLGINDVKIVYLDNLLGKNSPEEAIASDTDIDIAFVISPSAANLTDGEYANPNLHILTSTKVMNEAIKDVILVRKDWANTHKQELKKIRDSYLKSRSKIMDSNLIKQTAKLLFGSGEQGIADLSAMRDETRFHTKEQSNSFLYNPKNLVNLDRKASSIVAAFKKAGYIKNLTISKFDWNVKIDNKTKITKLSKENEVKVVQKIQLLDSKGQGQEIFKQNIFFKPNQSTFNISEYKDRFEESIKLSSVYGGAVIKIIGNVDPQLQRAWDKALEFKINRNKSKLLKVEKYLSKHSGHKYNLLSMSPQLIKAERNIVENAAKQASKERANAVKSAMIKYAQKQGYNLDAARLVVLGNGASNPVYSKPKNKQEFLKNMRVEFVITNYNSEISEFDEAQDF
jgi:hypothetical protein